MDLAVLCRGRDRGIGRGGVRELGMSALSGGVQRRDDVAPGGGLVVGHDLRQDPVQRFGGQERRQRHADLGVVVEGWPDMAVEGCMATRAGALPVTVGARRRLPVVREVQSDAPGSSLKPPLGARLSTSPTSQSRSPRSGHQTMARPPSSRWSAPAKLSMGSRMGRLRREERPDDGMWHHDGTAITSALEQRRVGEQPNLAVERHLTAVRAVHGAQGLGVTGEQDAAKAVPHVGDGICEIFLGRPWTMPAQAGMSRRVGDELEERARDPPAPLGGVVREHRVVQRSGRETLLEDPPEE